MERTNEETNAGLINNVSGSSEPWKLSHEQKLEIVQRIAEFWENREILAWLKAEHGIELDTTAITYYRKSEVWADQLQCFRATWRAGIDEEPFANPRARIDRLQQQLREVRKEIDERERYNKGEAKKDKLPVPVSGLRNEERMILQQIALETPSIPTQAAGGDIVIAPELAAGLQMPVEQQEKQE